MANDVTFDNNLSGSASGGTVSISYTVGSYTHLYMLAGFFRSDVYTTAMTTPQFNGTSMTLVTNNGGPGSSYGDLRVYGIKNPTTGTHNLTLSTGTDATEIYYKIYTYYNVGDVDTSSVNQGDFTARTYVTTSLTPGVKNALVWGFGGGENTSGYNLDFSEIAANNRLADSNKIGSAAGDTGVIATPSSQTAGVGALSGAGYADVALISLAPVNYSPHAAFLFNMI